MIRHLYPAGRHTSHTNDQQLRAAGRAQFIDGASGTGFGYPMLRDGSIVGLSCSLNITAHTSNGTMTLEVIKVETLGTSVVYSATSGTITGTGKVSWEATQDAGLDTVVAEDILLLKLTVDSGSFTWTDAHALLEVEHDEP